MGLRNVLTHQDTHTTLFGGSPDVKNQQWVRPRQKPSKPKSKPKPEAKEEYRQPFLPRQSSYRPRYHDDDDVPFMSENRRAGGGGGGQGEYGDVRGNGVRRSASQAIPGYSRNDERASRPMPAYDAEEERHSRRTPAYDPQERRASRGMAAYDIDEERTSRRMPAYDVEENVSRRSRRDEHGNYIDDGDMSARSRAKPMLSRGLDGYSRAECGKGRR
ncbi:MAG: hypothetical protein Q9164_007258 [Protoblastenia rupestris]